MALGIEQPARDMPSPTAHAYRGRSLTTPQRDVVVIGGGHNGLVLSFILATTGLDVLLLEQRDHVGGACSTEELFPGFHISTCSYICGMLHPRIVREMNLPGHGFRYVIPDPSVLAVFPDAPPIHLFPSNERTRQEIGRIDAQDAGAFPSWCDHWERAHKLLEPLFFLEPPTLAEAMKHAEARQETELLDELLEKSVAAIAERFFRDRRIQSTFVHIEDVGDPWTPGSALTETYFHPNRDATLGPALVIGGMGAVTAAMASAAVQAGVEIRTSTGVEEILVDASRASGVRLTDGTEVRARVVASNADPKRTLLNLLPSDTLNPTQTRSIEEMHTNAAYLKLHTTVDRLPNASRWKGCLRPEEISHIQIAPSLEHYRRAHQTATEGQMPAEPIIHLQIPTVYDRSIAPDNRHIVSAWALYAPTNPVGGWDAIRDSAAMQLVNAIDEYFPGYADSIVDLALFTPHDLERRLGMTAGNIRHLDMRPGQFLVGRPTYATPVSGLYLCGAGTHPGGEVTGLPGYNAATRILHDLRSGAEPESNAASGS